MPRSIPTRAVLLLGATIATACATPGARPSDAPARTVVRLTDVALVGGSPFDGRVAGTVLVYGSPGARVGLGADAPEPLADTLRLDHLPAITADVTDGEVHVALVGAGALRIRGTVTVGPATRVDGTGRHLTLLRGGEGIRARP